MRIGALEAGGTKMVCAVGNENGEILEQISIPTREPKATMKEILDYFSDKRLDAFGIAAFGPVDLKKGSETYGHILDTPKTEWKYFDLYGAVRENLGIPTGLDTDVNGSCLGEMTYGCAKGLDSVIYLTVGTGIGVGVGVNGRPLHGMLHPEGGHILLKRHPKDPAKGFCPWHQDCLEGLASGPALEKRWGKKGEALAEDARVWELESYYIAQALVNYIMLLSPQRIILGGGVMKQLQLFPLIRHQVLHMINGYLDTPQLRDPEHYIVPASLEGNQGILGCIRLGLDAFREERFV